MGMHSSNHLLWAMTLSRMYLASSCAIVIAGACIATLISAQAEERDSTMRDSSILDERWVSSVAESTAA